MKSDWLKQIEFLLKESENLLTENDINENRFNEFKNKCVHMFYDIREANINETVSNIATRGIKLKIKIIDGRLHRFIYNLLKSKDAHLFQAPFLIEHNEEANFKKYIFEARGFFDGIRLNLLIDDLS